MHVFNIINFFIIKSQILMFYIQVKYGFKKRATMHDAACLSEIFLEVLKMYPFRWDKE
jgi:hypothetical protein